MIQNPYGAVSDALKETRLSLRDIMSDFLTSKKMEQDLHLAKARAETDKAIVEAGIERDRLANTKDMAHLEESSRHNTAVEQNAADTLDLHRSGQEQQNTQFLQNLALQEKNLESENAVRQANAKLALTHAGHIANEEKRKMQPVTAQDFADRMGAGYMLPLMGINPTDTRPAYQWEQLATTIKGVMDKNPALSFISRGHGIKSELENLSAQYATPGLDPEAKTALKTQIGKKLSLLQTLDEMIMQVKEPDAARISESARKVWSDNPQLQTQYRNYDEFLPAYSSEVQKTRSHFHNNLKAIKINMAT